MFKSLIFFVRFFIFWLLFFAIDRLIFLIFFFEKIKNIPFLEVLSSFYHALRLDLSMVAYLVVIPLLFILFQFPKHRNQLNTSWINTYNRFFVVVFGVISVVNINIYHDWGTKVNVKVFSFLFNSPKEALASAASSPVFFSLLIFIILVTSTFLVHFLVSNKKILFKKESILARLLFGVLLLGFNFLLIRGGIDVTPNNQSMAYFSKQDILNQASLNTEWNLMSSVLAAKNTKENPYLFYENKVAEKLVKKIYHVKKDTTISILKTKKPNVVVFILESFTADLTYKLGKEMGVTPHFDSLMNKGFLFSKIYATGNRTDKGVIGSLAGFPTLGRGSIVKWPDKMQKIPAISQSFFNKGYQTSFFYGGESNFDNYKAFMLSHNYQKLVDKKEFDTKQMNSKWGVYDNLVFDKQLAHLKSSKQPFFSTILSLTNHEPFELPVNHKFGTKDNVQKFKSTAYFTDSCLNDYLSKAKKEKWYKNTLFIFVADHGHLYPKNKYDIFEPQRYHIPMLFFGEVIKDEFKGKSLDKVGSQQDLAATLLAQLDMPKKEFVWSKNLLNPYTHSFAYFSWDDGFGFINNKHCVTFDNVGKNILYNNVPKNKTKINSTLTFGKAYLQTAYQQFIKL